MTQVRKWTKSDSTEAVDVFMAALDHPHRALVEALRRAVLGADPGIAEGIKWNAPSFRTREYFATTHLRTKDGVGLVLHLGAKPKDQPPPEIADPTGLLRWLAHDRAMVVFATIDDLHARQAVLQGVLRQWLSFV